MSSKLTGFTLYLSCVSGIFLFLLICPGYQVGITIPFPFLQFSSSCPLPLVPLVEGYHYDYRTNGLPAVVSE